MKIHIKRFFDKAVDCYDSSADIQKIVASKLIEKTFLKNTKTVIEIGTGSGIFTELFLNKYKPENFIGFDIAYSMVKSCEKFPGLFIQADAERPPFKENSADAIVSSSVLQWLQTPQVSIPQTIKLLKSGGSFNFSIFCDGTFAEMSTINKLTGFGNVYPLKTALFYESLFNSISDIEFEIDVHDYVLNFKTVKEFLDKQKATGARFTGKRNIAGKEAYKNFCELYKSFFGDNQTIPVTYRIAYIRGVRT